MIEKLTPEQESLLPEFRDRWLQVGLCTDRLDMAEAEKSVRGLYSAAGLKEPEMVLFFSSPIMCLLARSVLVSAGQLRDQLSRQLSDQLWDQLRDQLSRQLSRQLSGQLSDRLSRQLSDRLSGQLWDQLSDQLSRQLSGQLSGQLSRQLSRQLSGQLWNQLLHRLSDQLSEDIYQSPWTIGSQDAYWLSFYEFARIIGAEYSQDKNTHLDAYIQYAKTCGWSFCYDRIALVSERPTSMRWDDRGLLHCEDGMAVEFSDGWGVSSWHGTRVPDEWIKDKGSLTPETALTWENVEQRRAAAEIIGWEKVLQKLSAKTIHKDPDPMVGELVEVDIPEIGTERFLRVLCGTGRLFALPVPPEMQTAQEANAWTWGLSANEYKPEVQT